MTWRKVFVIIYAMVLPIVPERGAATVFIIATTPPSQQSSNYWERAEHHRPRTKLMWFTPCCAQRATSQNTVREDTPTYVTWQHSDTVSRCALLYIYGKTLLVIGFWHGVVTSIYYTRWCFLSLVTIIWNRLEIINCKLYYSWKQIENIKSDVGRRLENWR